MGLVVNVGKEMSSNDPSVVLRHSVSRNPSEWSVKLLERAGVDVLGGVLEAPTLGSIGFRFSRVPPPTFSAAHTDLEYTKNHARDGGPPSHCIYVATGVPTSGNREKETGEFFGVPFGFRALSSVVAAVR